MASRTDAIAQELLDSIDTDGGPERVLDEHRKSKGPLYAGLGKATAIVEQRLDRRRNELQLTQSELSNAEAKVGELSAQVDNLTKDKEQLSQNLDDLREKVSDSQNVLDNIHQLEASGFGDQELARLGGLLGHISASKGAPPEDGVKQFFETVERYEKVVSLDLEATRTEARVDKAKAELGRWEAKARESEARSKASIATINAVDRLISKGVKERDILEWEKVSTKANLPPDTITAHLTKLGSLESVIRAKGQRAEQMKKESAALQAQVKVLERNRDAIQSSIQNFKTSAIQDMKVVGDKAKAYVDRLAEAAVEFGTVTAEAASMRRYVNVAKILSSQDQRAWGTLLPQDFKEMLTGFLLWMRHHEFDPQVQPPEWIGKRYFFSSTRTITLSELVLWAVSALFTRDERAALVGR